MKILPQFIPTSDKYQFGEEEKLDLCRLFFNFQDAYDKLSIEQKEYAGEKKISVPFGGETFNIYELFFKGNKLYAQGVLTSSEYSKIIHQGDFPIPNSGPFKYLKSSIENKIAMINEIKTRS